MSGKGDAQTTGKAVNQLPPLQRMSRVEIEGFISYFEKEGGLQEAILEGAEEGENAADVLARIKELGRWKERERAEKELARRPVERQPRRLLSLEELQAEAAKEIEWLIPGLRLPVGGSCLIAGAPGIGKSFLALHAAISVASGDHFLRYYPTVSGPVVYVDEESSLEAFNMRQAMLRNGNGLDLETLPFWVGVKQAFLLDHKGALNELINLLKPIKPLLVVLDALIRLHRGDENSAKDMQREIGCAIILIQHQRKEGLFRNRRDVVRGSSELTAWPDSVITLDRNADHHEAYILKSRFSEDGQVIIYRQFIDGDMAVLEFVREEEADLPKEAKAKRAIAELFTDDRIWTRNELYAVTKPMGFGRDVTIAALSALANEGTIKAWRGGPRGAYLYQNAEYAIEQGELVAQEV